MAAPRIPRHPSRARHEAPVGGFGLFDLTLEIGHRLGVKGTAGQAFGSSLDPNLRSRVRDDVAAILRATGTPAVFVTHTQFDAMAVGDRVAVMQGGRIVQIDTPERVFHAPTNRFVAAFMGDAPEFAVHSTDCSGNGAAHPRLPNDEHACMVKMPGLAL